MRLSDDKAREYYTKMRNIGVYSGYSSAALEIAQQLVQTNSPAEILKSLGKSADDNLEMDLIEASSGLEGNVTDIAGALAVVYRVLAHQGPSEGSPGPSKEEIEKLLKQELDKQSKAGGGKKGGDPSREYYKGYPLEPLWEGYIEGALPKLIVKGEMLKFANERVSTKKQEGKPKAGYTFRRIKQIRELKYCVTSQLTLPEDLFLYKFATRQLLGKIPVKTVSLPKTLVVLIDDSGSMSRESRVRTMVKVLEALFDAVRKGNLRLLIAPFEHGVGEFVEVSNAVQITAFKKIITTGAGGWTYLNRVLPDLVEQILAGVVQKKFPVPQNTRVLIVNDGEDEPNITTAPIPVHCVALCNSANREVKALCVNSGGDYVLIPDRDHD